MEIRLRRAQSPKFGFWVSHLPDDRFVGLHTDTDTFEVAPSTLFYELLKPTDVVVDAGANIGWYSLMTAHKGAHSLAFEPEPRAFEILQENIRQNNYEDHITARPAALGNRQAKIRVFQNMVNYGDNRVEKPFAGAVEIATVPLTTIDSLDEPISVVKVDTQGYEWHIWEGMQETVKRSIARGRLIMFTEFSITMPLFIPHKDEYFNALKETFGTVHIIIDRTGQAIPIDSVENIELMLKTWGHDHANLLLIKEN